MNRTHSSGRKRRFRAGIAFLLTLSLFFLSIPGAAPLLTVRAATMAETKATLSKLQEELKNLQKNSATARSEYESALAEYNHAQLDYELAKKAKIELDEEIYALETEIEKTKELLEIYTEQREVYEAAIVEKEAESEALFRKFLERVRINYEDSFTSYLEIVLSSDSFADLLYRVDVVASLLEYDKRIMNQLDLAKQSLEGLRADYQQLQIDTQEAYDSLKAQIPVLEQKQLDAEQLIKDLNAKLEEAMAKKDASAEIKAQCDAAVAAKQREEQVAQAELEKKIREAEEAEKARRRAEYVGGTLGWPVDISYSMISSYFSVRYNPLYGYQEYHNGIDIPVPYGTAILAANAGTVITSEYHYSYGYYVVIDHGGGLTTLYAHNSRLLVSVGDAVVKGQTIAKAGSTGYSTGNHCHFSVRQDSVAKDPLNYVVQP